jgi:hypothetical protein
MSARHDPTRGATATFYATLVQRKATELALRNTRAKRDRERERPLDAACEVPDAERYVAVDRRLDVGAALVSLPAADRQLAWQLADDNLIAVARRNGISRQHARSARLRIRRHLQDCGVER